MPDVPLPVVYRMKVSQRGISPMIWRRLLIPADLTLYGLHRAIQIVFGWQDSTSTPSMFWYEARNVLRTADRRNVFDIHLLAERVVEALAWVCGDAEADGMPIGLFGASTGAAAALVAAAAAPDDVAAVVSRGGRPDLAGDALERVRAPVLLIVGGADEAVLDLNRSALARLTAIKKLEIVPGATHLFEEPGALEAVVVLAANWFEAHCRRGAS